MAFHYFFRAEHALLMGVKSTLEQPEAWSEAEAAMCILSCQAALESILNNLLTRDGRLTHWNELRFTSKIDTIADLNGSEIDWGVQPWQDVAQINRMRNFLAHNKESQIGLLGAGDNWIDDDGNSPPKIDYRAETKIESLRAYYDSTREAGLLLAKMAGATYEFLETEDYRPVIKG